MGLIHVPNSKLYQGTFCFSEADAETGARLELDAKLTKPATMPTPRSRGRLIEFRRTSGASAADRALDVSGTFRKPLEALVRSTARSAEPFHSQTAALLIMKAAIIAGPIPTGV